MKEKLGFPSLVLKKLVHSCIIFIVYNVKNICIRRKTKWHML